MLMTVNNPDGLCGFLLFTLNGALEGKSPRDFSSA